MKVLFVCLGNICRSPTAEAVLQHMANERGLDIQVDSAGTAAYHIGKQPDSRTQKAAMKRGISMGHLKARQVDCTDLREFDVVFAMDSENFENLKRIEGLNPRYLSKLKLFLADYGDGYYRDVPDPYYGGEDGFDQVFDLISNACEKFISEY